MRYLKLLLHFVFMSIQRELTHKANLVADVTMSLFGIVTSLFALGAIYTQIDKLAGWSFGSALILLGTYQLLSSVINALVTPNLSFFREKVISGMLDDYLLRPVSSLFTASLGMSSPLALLQVIPGAALIIAGAAQDEGVYEASNWLFYMIGVGSGMIMAWGYRVLLACLTFWAPGTEPSVLYDACWELGRFPISIYHPRVQILLTFIVPVAFIGFIPASVLTGTASWRWGIGSAAAALVMLIAARLVWSAGLRKYTSASS
jgi:ABC-2 type transport system permease protein